MGVNTSAVQRLYVAYFNRPADPVGLAYWESQLPATAATQAQLTALAAGFSGSAEYAALYAGQTNTQIINSLYNNLFGRDAEPAGLVYWAGALTAGTYTFAQIALQLTYSAQGTDATAIANKLAAATAFTAALDTTAEIVGYSGMDAAASARAWLATVTDVPATLTAAIAPATLAAAVAAATVTGTGVIGETFTLTTGVDTVVGTLNNDTITGVFGGATGDTFTVADSIDGNDGTDTLALTAQGTTASPAAVTVKNVEKITVRDLVGATVNAVLIENSPTISFTNTLAAQTSTVTNASTASTFGLAGAGNLTVDFASTSGAADTAKVALSGVGTSATVRSTVNVSDANTIEAVSIAASGTNFVTLTAGTVAKTVTVTGSGTNDIDVSAAGAVAGVVTLDASAATGANTFVMGNTLNTIDVIKGGTASDKVSANFTTATLVKPTMTGVETFAADFDAAAILDLSSTTGLTTVTLSGSTAHQTINKAAASVATLNVTSQGDADNNLTFGYATATPGDLALKIGGAADITLLAVDLNNTSSLALSTVGAMTNDLNGITLNGDQSAISVNVTAGSDLYTAGIDVATDGDVGAFDIVVGAGSVYSGGLDMSGGLGSVSMSVGNAGAAQAYISNVGDVGDVTITGTGQANMGMGVSGSVGNISISLDGAGASGSYFGAEVSGGSIGDIDITVTNFANIDFDVSANAFSFGDTDENGTDGNVGNVTINVGAHSYVSGNIEASGGDIGNVSVTVNGDNASGNMDLYASFVSGDTDGDLSADDYVRGGNIGDVTVDINGNDANFDLYALASGGNIGNVSFSIAGNNASGYIELHANAQGSGAPGGNIGDITINAGDDTAFDMGISADLDIGPITLTAGDSVSAGFYISGGNSGAAMLSDITVNMGADAEFDLRVSGFGGDVATTVGTFGDGSDVWAMFSQVSGSIGNVDLTVGNNASGSVYFSGNGGDIGDVTMEGGANSEFYVSVSGGADSMGEVTFIGGVDTSSSAGVYVSDTGSMIASMGGVNASAWMGELGVDLEGVTLGTTITVGTGGSWVRGSEGADNIFLGAGSDEVEFDLTPTSVDTIFSFTAGATKDVLDVANAANFTAYAANTADTLISGDFTKLTDIAGGDDITTAAGLLAALNGGEYGLIDATAGAGTYSFITAASASATTYYVFNAVETADANFDSVTLIGVVNANSAFSAFVAGNIV